LGVNSISQISTNLSEIKTYPNPFVNTFSFDLNEKVVPSAISLFDTQGKTLPISLENKEGNNYKVNTYGLPNGIYFQKINTDQDYKRLKIIKLQILKFI
jgi:hypothetical protein